MAAGDSNREERQARSLALERAYVHDVYDKIAHHFADTRYRPWPRVRQFLEDLEPGSLVADVGCGNGKYLDINPEVIKIGMDRCAALTEAARSRGHEVLTCDALCIPFREEAFDAVLSIAVIHHFATTERRVEAIKELTRVLRIGGKVLITVWAMEQRHRKFDSQDVLVPWHEPIKSSSEDRGSSVERELTSTTTSDDDVLVYQAYSHISDGEGHHLAHAKKKLKYRNGRGRYRSSEHPGSSQSSSELSSPNETCYSFVRRAFQKLSNSASTTDPYDNFNKKSSSRPYFYRSCRKPCVSDSMEFGSAGKGSRASSPRNDLKQQDSIESEYQDDENENDIPIEIRHLEGYETCKKCGSPDFGNCEGNVCTSCLPPTDSDSSSKKSRSLGDFLNMIPKLLRVKKCEKEPLSDLHKRISTASDPREYVVKTRGANPNGIVRSRSTVSFMSRLEELMSMSMSIGKDDQETFANPNCPAGPRLKAKPSRMPSLNSPLMVDGSERTIAVVHSDTSTNPRRHISPADALRKLRQDISIEEPVNGSKIEEKDRKLEDKDKSSLSPQQTGKSNCGDGERVTQGNEQAAAQEKSEKEAIESHLSSYYSMPELYKLADDHIPQESIFNSQTQKAISFLEQAQNILADSSVVSNELNSCNTNSPLHYRSHERNCINIPQRGLVKRSLSVDTGDNSSTSHQVPRRFSASAAQGVLASALRTYTLPRSCSRGSSVKSDTSVDSEESIVSVIPRKGNSITSDTSVDSEESVISVIQRSTSDIDTLGNQNGLRNLSRFGSRSAQASPITVLSSQTSSAESSPPQSGKNDGRFPGNSGVIDQLMQQQNLLGSDGLHFRHDMSEYGLRSRRCLLRPVSDPKIEDKWSSQSSGDMSPLQTSRPSSLDEAKPGRSFEMGTSSFEKYELHSKICRVSPNYNTKALVDGLDVGKEPTEQKETTDGELSRTPSPVGPIQYITDPLITGIDGSVVSENCKENQNHEAESKTKCLRFENQMTNLEQKKQISNSAGISTVEILPSLKPLKSQPINALEKNNLSEAPEMENPNISNSVTVSSKESPQETKEDDPPTTPQETSNKGSDSEVRRSLFKLKERLESLTASQNSIQSFDLFKNVGHSLQGIGTLKNIKEKIESDISNDQNRDSKASPTPKSLNDSRQSSLDESSLVTLSDESVMSVEGTSSVSDEANDYRKTDDEDVDSSQNITVRKATDAEKCGSASPKSLVSDVGSAKSEIVENGLPPLPKQTKAPSFSDTELHSRKGSVRSVLRKRLRRSCVTIDEVECRDFISSEDTSPSSTVSLEWNDFDKIDTDSSSGQACCSSLTVASDIPKDEPSIEICDDVNVAETEMKFNVFGDKEMCVFFETPSSSIGKSASSSSNATDFSTTSDRIRGVMQREKSDDRSSKESDSDNLSKLSDLETKSDSAFSEDFARKTDIVSSSSSASLDILDSIKSRLSGDSEFEVSAIKAKQTSNWVLHNIDEMPDDDQTHEEGFGRCCGKSPTPSTSWSGEQSMDFAQKGENFLSCAADCRDMYRISFDAKLPKESGEMTAQEEIFMVNGVSSKMKSEVNSHMNGIEDTACNFNESYVAQSGASSSHAISSKLESGSSSKTDAVTSSVASAASDFAKLNGTIGMRVPDLAPEVLELFPRRTQRDEGQTDILAAFVETISDLTAVFQELYPRQENKFDDLSSDESVEISGFERILTSSNPPKSSQNIPNVPKDEKETEGNSSKKTENSRTCNNESAYKPSINSNSTLKCNNIGQTFVKLPPESDDKQDDSNDKKCNDRRKSDDLRRRETNKHNIPPKPENNSPKLSNLNKIPEKTKALNRSSQSVCLERVRQDSFEKDDESSLSTHSAPCSPRMKPRQRSVEDVLSSSRTELSRTSSLSQSTSQESLPGNDVGGLMSCHRYYHVFRQGELDSLIENHVDNLHIISSYYDHANWCVVAEKVQVWTI